MSSSATLSIQDTNGYQIPDFKTRRCLWSMNYSKRSEHQSNKESKSCSRIIKSSSFLQFYMCVVVCCYFLFMRHVTKTLIMQTAMSTLCTWSTYQPHCIVLLHIPNVQLVRCLKTLFHVRLLNTLTVFVHNTRYWHLNIFCAATCSYTSLYVQLDLSILNVTIKFFGTLTKSTNTDLLSLGTFIIIL